MLGANGAPNIIKESHILPLNNTLIRSRNERVQHNITWPSDVFDLNAYINKINAKPKTSTKANLETDMVFGLKVNKFIFDKFVARELESTIVYNKKTINILETKFNTCGGSISLNTNIEKLQNGSFIGSEIYLDSVDINKLFYSFNNFNQSFILDKNLKGIASGSVMITSSLNSTYDFVWKDLNAKLDFTISKGELNDFEPLEKLSRFVELNELKHLTFNELKNTIFIKNQAIHIPQMDILSSAFNINISGIHNFDNNFTYHMQVLLSEVLSKKQRKRKPESEFGEIQDDGLGRTRLFLNISGTPENHKVKYDKKKVREKINQDIETEKEVLKEIFKEEFKIFRNKKPLKETNSQSESKKFIIKWEEENDSLN